MRVDQWQAAGTFPPPDRDRQLLKTMQGRDYRLLGNWIPRHQTAAEAPFAASATPYPAYPGAVFNLPVLATRLIGRAEAVQCIRAR